MGHLAWDAPYRPRRALLRERAEQAPEPVPPVIASATVPARGPTLLAPPPPRRGPGAGAGPARDRLRDRPRPRTDRSSRPRCPLCRLCPLRRRRRKPSGAQKPEMLIVDIYLLLGRVGF